MGKDKSTVRVTVGALAELDALVGRYVTGEKPQTHWEDSHAQLRFDSIEEALEALREPYFQQFIPEDDRASTVLREIQEFRRYSSDLSLAWELVEKISKGAETLHMRREGDGWRAAFGETPFVASEAAPVAICLAGLRARGIEVDFTRESYDEHDTGSPYQQGSLLSVLRGGMSAD